MLRKQMVIFFMVAAVVMASLAYFLLFLSPEEEGAGGNQTTPAAEATAAPGPQVVQIEGLVVTLDTDPQKAVQLQSAAAPTTPPILEQAGDIGQQTTDLPTSLPLQPTAEATLLPVVPIEPTAVPPAPVASPPIIVIQYQVQANDTLYSVANQQNSSIELMATYGIDAQDLSPGAVINLPVANPAYCPGSRPYVVRENDTAYSIARRYGTTAEVLRQMNGLDAEYTIYTASVLCVP